MARFHPVLVFLLVGGCAGNSGYVSPGPRVMLRFVSASQRETKPYELTLRNEEEKEPLSCRVPCTLQIASGTTDITVTGPVQYQKRLVIPPVDSIATLHVANALRLTIGLSLMSGFLLAGAGAGLGGKIYESQKNFEQAAISYGVGVGLLSMALLSSIVVFSAGRTGITMKKAPMGLRLEQD